MPNERPVPVQRLRQMARVGDAASSALQTALRPVRTLGFPYRRPTVPRGVEVPEPIPTLGAHFDTDWARRAPARLVRKVVVAGPLRAMVQWLASPEVSGTDRLADLADADPVPALRSEEQRLNSSH